MSRGLKTRTVAYFAASSGGWKGEEHGLENRANGATAAVATLSPGELERFELVRRGSSSFYHLITIRGG